jgi:hypothetical protein
MNASEHKWSPTNGFGRPRYRPEMTPAAMDLGYDLVIEDLDETATPLAPMCSCPNPLPHGRTDLRYDLVIEDLDETAASLAPMCSCPNPLPHDLPSITGHARPRERQALVTC